VLPWGLRQAAAIIRRHAWIPDAAAFASLCVWIYAVLSDHGRWWTLSAGAALFVSAYVAGYSRRALKQILWPPLNHLERGSYCEVWDSIATSAHGAAMAVSGHGEEEHLRRSSGDTVLNLLELADIRAVDEVLEIGCGVARIGLEIGRHCRQWTGADISANMLRYAAERIPKSGNMRLVHLREVGLAKFPDGSFDVVYSTNVFPHLDELDRWRYVQEAFRVLGPGGRIFIDNVDLESEAGWTIFANDGMRFANLQRPPYMPRYSTAAELMSYATRAGFQEVAAHRRSPLVVVTGTKKH
jgi:SAM-dependent methyltransferase